MQATLLLVQYVSQNIALFCCALFAGAATYVSLVEQPAIRDAGRDMAGTYVLLAQPRPVLFQTFFSSVGALAGISAGVAGSGTWWLAGGLVLSTAALFQIFAVMPEMRQLAQLGNNADAGKSRSEPQEKLTRLHAIQSLAGLVALFTFIMKA